MSLFHLHCHIMIRWQLGLTKKGANTSSRNKEEIFGDAFYFVKVSFQFYLTKYLTSVFGDVFNVKVKVWMNNDHDVKLVRIFLFEFSS